MSRRRVAIGVGANMLDRAAGAIIQLVLVPVLASHWGLERYGGWAMLATVPGLFALGDLGFANAATVRMTMQVARGERDAAQVTVHSATQVVLGACALVVLAVAGIAMSLPDRFILDVPLTSNAEMREGITWLAVYAALVMASGLLQGVFRSTSRYALGAFMSTLTTLLENGLLVAAVVTGHGIAAAAFALMIGRLSGVGVTFAVAASLRTGLLPGFWRGTTAERRQLLRPALAAMSIPLATALLLQGTVAALGFAAGAAVVPAFVAARTLSRIGLQGSQMLTTALMPEFGAATATGNWRGVVRMVVLVLGSAMAITIPFSLVLGLAGPWIIKLWSNAHIHAEQSLTFAIAVSALCGGIWNPMSNLMLAINRQSEFAITYCWLALAGVLLTLALAGTLGSTAPALAQAAVDLAMLLVVMRFAVTNWGGFGQWRAAAGDIGRELRADFHRLLGTDS